jgi:nucleotide-binding universal stress UspA family protein
MFSGSTTMHLMRKCPCPVWAVKPSKKKQYHRILAAVDPSPFHSDHLKLAKKIMELAVSLAESDGAELHVLHCWSSSFEKTLRNRSGLLPSDADEIVRQIRTSHKSSLDSLVEEFDLTQTPHKVHLLKGEPERVIVDMASKKRMELVVMGTVSRKGLSGFLIGNTAEKALNQLECSVLAVKPDGFVSIVTLDE